MLGRLRAIRIRLAPPKPKPLILMYHRIAETPADPWGLAVSPAHFEEQLDFLCRTRQPMRLGDFVRALYDGTLPREAVAITFDDGYVDNLLAAKPRLKVARVPATVFLSTGHLGRSEEFWWDELTRLILCEHTPGRFAITAGSRTLHFDLADEAARPPEPGRSKSRRGKPWRALIDRPETARQAAYVAIWESLRPLDEPARNAAMAQLRTAFSERNSELGSGRPMTLAEAKDCAADDLIEIGAHAVTHPPLATLSPAEQEHEIVESKLACQRLTGREIDAFAYPYGDFDSSTAQAVSAAGFRYACSVVAKPVSTNDDRFALPRLQVFDQPAAVFDRALRWAVLGH